MIEMFDFPEEPRLSELTLGQLADRVQEIGEVSPQHAELTAEAAKKIIQLANIASLIGNLAPGGTAPRTALEQMWRQSESSGEVSEEVLYMRQILESHYGEWTARLREIEGLSQE